MGEMTTPAFAGVAISAGYEGLESINDVREHVSYRRAQQRQDDDHNDGDQHEDEGVFDETLTFFTRKIQHDDYPFQG